MFQTKRGSNAEPGNNELLRMVSRDSGIGSNRTETVRVTLVALKVAARL